jgi:hypothetical protein
MSFHMGSLGFLTPFQFTSSEDGKEGVLLDTAFLVREFCQGEGMQLPFIYQNPNASSIDLV